VRKWLFLLILLVSYSLVVVPLSHYQQERPFVEKVGYLPTASVLRLCSADQAIFLGTWLIGKAVSYYGGLYQQEDKRTNITPDYAGIYQALSTGLQLDPYNMDGYYFAQATLVWDMKRVSEANSLLERGLLYRDWDFYLPYFLGFNYAYFLKDYGQAAKYYKRVAELTDDDLSIRLTGRYLYESGQTDLAVSYLMVMIQGARNDAVKKTLQTRLEAFIAVRKIERAYRVYVALLPDAVPDIETLVSRGFLEFYPVDPYGGTFFVDDKGKVMTTSNFAHASKK
jgi:tetratricopeptide (TPR) repeat protein